MHEGTSRCFVTVTEPHALEVSPSQPFAAPARYLHRLKPEYTLRHTDLPKGALDRITTKYYDCGHMLYANPKSEPVLNRNINQFIAKASSTH